LDLKTLIDVGSKVSLAVVLMVIIYGNIAGYWVSGSTLKDVQADRDTWKQLALKGANIATQAAHTVVTARIGDRAPTLSPLPSVATPQEVESRLNVVQARTAYKTEPTDKPLP
jgi:hypothetical protein